MKYCSKRTETETQTDGQRGEKIKALFFNLAWADKTTAFTDLSGASVQKHYLDG